MDRAKQALAPPLQVLEPHLPGTRTRLAEGHQDQPRRRQSGTFSSWIRSSMLREAVSWARNRLMVLVQSGSSMFPASSRTTRSNPRILSGTEVSDSAAAAARTGGRAFTGSRSPSLP